MPEDKNRSDNNGFVERRRFPRLNISADVEYSVLEKVPPEIKKSLSKNISAGGICVIFYEDVKPGTILDLKINLSDINYTIETKGRVVWRSSFSLTTDTRPRYDTGVEFIDIKESDRQKLSQYVLKEIK